MQVDFISLGRLLGRLSTLSGGLSVSSLNGVPPCSPRFFTALALSGLLVAFKFGQVHCAASPTITLTAKNELGYTGATLVIPVSVTGSLGSLVDGSSRDEQTTELASRRHGVDPCPSEYVVIVHGVGRHTVSEGVP